MRPKCHVRWLRFHFKRISLRDFVYRNWAVRALTIIDYWSSGPKATFIFFMCLPLFAHFKKCKGSQWKAFLWFEWKGRGSTITKLLSIGLRCRILPMVYKSNNSCISKQTFYFLWLLPFLRVLRDTLSISLEMCKKGRGQKK